MKKNIKIGSKFTFLDSVDSTNNYTAKLRNEGKIVNGQVIMADFQGEGRGQRGSTWHSERGLNLLVSFYIELDNLSVKNQSHLLKYTAVSIFETLNTLGLQSKIKWPNDILINGNKICGILIENQFSGQKIKNSIIGIGLNVNQENFHLENITSLKLELKKEQERLTILGVLCDTLNKNIDLLENNSDYLINSYIQNLFRINEEGKFHHDKLGDFYGVITGVDANGLLQVKTENGCFSFDVKELKYY